jgi:hypothetical protein
LIFVGDNPNGLTKLKKKKKKKRKKKKEKRQGKVLNSARIKHLGASDRRNEARCITRTVHVIVFLRIRE